MIIYAFSFIILKALNYVWSVFQQNTLQHDLHYQHENKHKSYSVLYKKSVKRISEFVKHQKCIIFICGIEQPTSTILENLLERGFKIIIFEYKNYEWKHQLKILHEVITENSAFHGTMTIIAFDVSSWILDTLVNVKATKISLNHLYPQNLTFSDYFTSYVNAFILNFTSKNSYNLEAINFKRYSRLFMERTICSVNQFISPFSFPSRFSFVQFCRRVEKIDSQNILRKETIRISNYMHNLKCLKHSSSTESAIEKAIKYI